MNFVESLKDNLCKWKLLVWSSIKYVYIAL